MRELTLSRDPSTDVGTFGKLFEGEDAFCLTIERPWINNARGISCIPKGVYVAQRVPLSEHPHIAHIIHTPGITSAFVLQDVPERTGIFIHPANVMSDLEGCIGLGTSRADNIKHGLPGVTNSQLTFAQFMERYKDEQELKITIA